MLRAGRLPRRRARARASGWPRSPRRSATRSACSSSTCCASTPGRCACCELVPLFDISQPTLSHHLKKLRDAGLVDCERRGLWAYYYVIPDALEELSGLADLNTIRLRARRRHLMAIRHRPGPAAASQVRARYAAAASDRVLSQRCRARAAAASLITDEQRAWFGAVARTPRGPRARLPDSAVARVAGLRQPDGARRARPGGKPCWTLVPAAASTCCSRRAAWSRRALRTAST